MAKKKKIIEVNTISPLREVVKRPLNDKVPAEEIQKIMDEVQSLIDEKNKFSELASKKKINLTSSGSFDIKEIDKWTANYGKKFIEVAKKVNFSDEEAARLWKSLRRPLYKKIASLQEKKKDINGDNLDKYMVSILENKKTEWKNYSQSVTKQIAQYSILEKLKDEMKDSEFTVKKIISSVDEILTKNGVGFEVESAGRKAHSNHFFKGLKVYDVAAYSKGDKFLSGTGGHHTSSDDKNSIFYFRVEEIDKNSILVGNIQVDSYKSKNEYGKATDSLANLSRNMISTVIRWANENEKKNIHFQS